jgi:hypothetical protein
MNTLEQRSTICAECKHHTAVPVTFYEDCSYRDCCGATMYLDKVTGEREYTRCKDHNNGACPDFEVKEKPHPCSWEGVLPPLCLFVLAYLLFCGVVRFCMWALPPELP